MEGAPISSDRGQPSGGILLYVRVNPVNREKFRVRNPVLCRKLRQSCKGKSAKKSGIGIERLDLRGEAPLQSYGGQWAGGRWRVRTTPGGGTPTLPSPTSHKWAAHGRSDGNPIGGPNWPGFTFQAEFPNFTLPGFYDTIDLLWFAWTYWTGERRGSSARRADNDQRAGHGGPGHFGRSGWWVVGGG